MTIGQTDRATGTARRRFIAVLAPLLVAAATLAPAGPALADIDVTVSKDGASADRIAVSYTCTDGETREVIYLNLDPVAIAIIPTTDGDTLVFANVISGSGSRYVASIWQWWEKGGEATLSDVRSGTDTPKVTCRAPKI